MARAQVREDYNRAATYGNSWSMVGVTVDILKAGVQLACGGLWGIESYSGRDYFERVARNTIDEITQEARDVAARLAKELAA
jgi:hypothetical protein